MAKGDAAETKSMINSASTSSNAQHNQLYNNLYGQLWGSPATGNFNNVATGVSGGRTTRGTGDTTAVPRSGSVVPGYPTSGGLMEGFGTSPYGYGINATGFNPYQVYSDFASGAGTSDEAGRMGAMIGGIDTSKFQSLADTGGFSGKDIQDFRARSLSPLYSTYANAADEVNRTRSLQGGYSPNAIAAQSQMARQLGHEGSRVSTEAEATLADQIRQGKVAGAQGLLSAQSQKAALTEAMNEFLTNAKFGGAAGMTGIDQSNTQNKNSVISMLLSSLLNNQGQSDTMNSNMVNARIGASQIPSDFGTALGYAGNIGSIGNLFKNWMSSPTGTK